jgi:DNA (cytosine-5)-methyltransferase 1
MFNYDWKLSDGYPASGVDNHKLKVFGTFICGGGSSMGYKLAGYEHLGGVEIDPRMAKVYKHNHKPKYLFNEDIRDFNKRDDIPEELFDLDILDGSPPCSSFSMSGSREKGWGKKKKFTEGQAEQTLDDLFFDYIYLAKKLQPKVVVAENVKGLITGNAKSYVKRIKKKFEETGYSVQLFLLNASVMGVPQRRERVFFICQRNDLKLEKLNLCFNEKPIKYKQIEDDNYENKITPCDLVYFDKCLPGKSISTVHPKGNRFNSVKMHPGKVVNTITADGSGLLYHYAKKKALSNKELSLAGSYPLDYNFMDLRPKYLIGMSVPPVMTAQIAYQIYLQWFK